MINVDNSVISLKKNKRNSLFKFSLYFFIFDKYGCEALRKVNILILYTEFLWVMFVDELHGQDKKSCFPCIFHVNIFIFRSINGQSRADE